MPKLLTLCRELIKFWNDLGWLANFLAVAVIMLPAIGKIRAMMSRRRQKRRSVTNTKMNSASYLEWMQRVISKIYAGRELVSLYGKNILQLFSDRVKNFFIRSVICVI